MEELTIEQDCDHTISLFNEKVEEGFRRHGCSASCIQLSMGMLRRDEVGSLEVWDNLAESTRSSYPIELRSILNQMRKESERAAEREAKGWWNGAFPSLSKVIVICLTFWCIEIGGSSFCLNFASLRIRPSDHV
jgi:hypothetical protein